MPFDTPNSIAGGEWCRTIRLPDDEYLISILLEQITDLGRAHSWFDSGDVPVNTVSDIFSKCVADLIADECETMAYPRNAFIPGSLARKLIGSGTITTEQSSAWMLGQRTYLSSPAVGDMWEYHVFLAEGSYTMRHVIQRVNSSNGCTVDWELDGDLVIDNMSFLGSSANVQINTPVGVLFSGVHRLIGEVVAVTGSAQPAPIHYIQFVDSVIAVP